VDLGQVEHLDHHAPILHINERYEIGVNPASLNGLGNVGMGSKLRQDALSRKGKRDLAITWF